MSVPDDGAPRRPAVAGDEARRTAPSKSPPSPAAERPPRAPRLPASLWPSPSRADAELPFTD